jgi:hypothetical protein
MFICLVVILLYIISALALKLAILISNLGIIIISAFVLFLLSFYDSVLE